MDEQKKVFQSGAVLDARTEEEKERDYKLGEVVASVSPVNWIEKSGYRRFPIFNQDGSGSCVAQTQAKELGIMRWLKDGNYVHFSATDIYQRRANKPYGGMGAIDVRSIAAKGVTLEVLCPSQDMNDAQMDTQTIEPYKREVGMVFSVPNYIEDPVADIETIASVIQATGKGVMVWFYFKIEEWTERPKVLYPDLDLYAATTLRHSVTAVDFTLIAGKKCLIIDDSWGTGFGTAGQRTIDEDFFKARNWYAGHLVNFKFELPPVAPKHTFTKPLTLGMTDPDVVALQDILKYEQFFPTNTDSTGFYGGVTASGVLKWQLKHQVDTPDALNALQGKRVGSLTISKLNSIYGS